MDPLAAILQAANGHAGLPPSVTMAPGAQVAQMPPSAGSGQDRQVAQQGAQHIQAFAAHASDPALKAIFSSALAALHKYLAQDDKEHQQALQGKFSPRQMAKASRPNG